MTFTKDKAKELRNAFECWQQDYDPVDDKEQYDMFGSGVDAMDALLASLEAEPVAYIFRHPAGRLFWALTDESNKGQSDVMPVYAAPPAPVSVPDAMEPVLKDGEIIAYERHGERFSTVVGATWNACRAAMLQGAEPPAYEIKRFGEFGANGLTRDDGELAVSIQFFHFERGTTPQPVRGGGIVEKYALQAIINALQQQCDRLSDAPIPVVWPAAPQQEVLYTCPECGEQSYEDMGYGILRCCDCGERFTKTTGAAPAKDGE